MSLEDEIVRIIDTETGHTLGVQGFAGAPSTNKELTQEVQALTALLRGYREAMLYLAREIEDARPKQ